MSRRQQRGCEEQTAPDLPLHPQGERGVTIKVCGAGGVFSLVSRNLDETSLVQSARGRETVKYEGLEAKEERLPSRTERV